MVPSLPFFTVGPLEPGKLSTAPGMLTTEPLGKISVVKCIVTCARPFTPARTDDASQ